MSPPRRSKRGGASVDKTQLRAGARGRDTASCLASAVSGRALWQVLRAPPTAELEPITADYTQTDEARSPPPLVLNGRAASLTPY